MYNGGLYITSFESEQLKVKYENSGTPTDGVGCACRPLSVGGDGHEANVSLQ